MIETDRKVDSLEEKHWSKHYERSNSRLDGKERRFESSSVFGAMALSYSLLLLLSFNSSSGVISSSGLECELKGLNDQNVRENCVLAAKISDFWTKKVHRSWSKLDSIGFVEKELLLIQVN